MRASEEDHIVALATAPGRAALAVVRISGPSSKSIARKIFRPWPEPEIVARSPVLGRIESESGEVLDQVLLTWFPGPASYTGEEVVEVSCHGSPFIAGQIVELLIRTGARLAEPGEFTKRAFLNGKLDLTQAEAVRDLIESQTVFQSRLATEQLGGSLSRRLEPIKTELINVLSHMETALEFVDDEVEPEQSKLLQERLDRLQARISGLEEGFELGQLVRAGIAVVITGAPNAGKSSVFNSLLKNDRALVTSIPGTTRDAVTGMISIQGWPARLIDTAGIRTARDRVEELGIAKTLEYLASADVVLFVLDGNRPFGSEEREIWDLVRDKGTILVVNKSDLPQKICLPPEAKTSERQRLSTSALKGDGMKDLVAAVWREVNLTSQIEKDTFFLTSIRHYEAIVKAREWLTRGMEAYRQGWSEEFPIHDFRKALEALGTITGDTTVEDILDQIFSTFCIGK